MARTSAAPKTVTADWNTFIGLDDEDRRELIDGHLKVTEVPTKLHEWIVTCLSATLWAWAKAKKAGTVLGSGYKIRISKTRGVMPDVLFIRKGRAALADDQGMTRGAPDLVVEVISPGSGRHDRVRKMRWYAEIGVRDYWIIDPVGQTFERLVLGKSGHYVVTESLSENDVFKPREFDGLVIDLAELWTMPE